MTNSLRPMRPEDSPMVRGWRNLPEVAKYMYTDHLIGAEEHAAWFEKALTDPARRYWIIECDGSPVGLANLYDIDPANKRCSWAFYLADPSVRGKGVGSFVEHAVLVHVFDELKLDKLSCEVLDFNTPVVKMHESFGFRREGLFRSHVAKGGRAHDVVRLAMLRDEWVQARPRIEAKLAQRDRPPSPSAPAVAVGARASLSRVVTEELVGQFAAAVGDMNPVHMDPQFAAGSRFGQRVAHGMIGASLISAVLGNELPGPGTIYVEQSLKFEAPVFLGDTLTAEVVATEVRSDKPVVKLATTCRKQNGVVVLSGHATVVVDQGAKPGPPRRGG